VEHFLKLNQITVEPGIKKIGLDSSDDVDWVEVRQWRERGKREFTQYIVHGGGHTLPGANEIPSLVFGKTSYKVNIADETVEFFFRQID